MADGEARAREAILARRARFIAAALAGVGIALPAGAKPEQRGKADAADPTQEEEAPEPEPYVGPSICLSDDTIEGELVKPPPLLPVPDEEEDASPLRPGPLGDIPQVCLSIIAPWDDSDSRHDGAYLRASAGVATGRVGGIGGVTYSGFAFDLAGGLTFTPTVAVGVGAGFNLGPWVRFEGQDTGAGRVSEWLVGPEFLVFPDPRKGWHFGARLGPLGVGLAERPVGDALLALGFGASATAGTGLWLSSQLSLEVALRGTLGIAWADDAGVSRRLDAQSLSLLLGLNWH